MIHFKDSYIPDDSYTNLINSKEFKTRLDILNERLRQSLVENNFPPVIIGNIFYDHLQVKPPFFNSPLNEECIRKRARVARAAQESTNMFEIGLNGGHSSFLALSSNPSLKVTANDIAAPFIVHPEIYAPVAAKILKHFFNDRFSFIKGNCLHQVPIYVNKNKNTEIDLVHLDGAKSTYKQDFLNLIPILKDGALVIFDDFQQGGIRAQARDLKQAGFLHDDSNYPTTDLKKYRLTNEILRYKKPE
tara:strand:- start:3025 stop:3762 length:738 start_codon:yes stop_codon:yes gene_type:complete